MSAQAVFDTRGYLKLQTALVLGPDNRWFAGEAFGHEPSDEECWRHWCMSGAAKCFASHFSSWFSPSLDSHERSRISLLVQKIIRDGGIELGQVG